VHFEPVGSLAAGQTVDRGGIEFGSDLGGSEGVSRTRERDVGLTRDMPGRDGDFVILLAAGHFGRV